MDEGWLIPELPETFDADLRARGVPCQAIPVIKSMAELYRAERDNMPTLTQAEVRQELEQIEAEVLRLQDRLHRMDFQTADAIAIAGLRSGQADAARELRQKLSHFGALLSGAWQSIEPRVGRPVGARLFMAVEIARELRRHGVEPSSQVAAPFCQALRTIFDAIDEPGRGGLGRPDATNIARSAIAQLG